MHSGMMAAESTRANSRVSLAFIAGLGGPQMNRKGIEYGLKRVEPELWEWQFQIGETVTTARLMGMAAHRVQQRIDRTLKARDADRNAMGSTTSHPVMTSERTAPTRDGPLMGRL
jgi:hypothetical protein